MFTVKCAGVFVQAVEGKQDINTLQTGSYTAEIQTQEVESSHLPPHDWYLSSSTDPV